MISRRTMIATAAAATAATVALPALSAARAHELDGDSACWEAWRLMAEYEANMPPMPADPAEHAAWRAECRQLAGPMRAAQRQAALRRRLPNREA